MVWEEIFCFEVTRFASAIKYYRVLLGFAAVVRYEELDSCRLLRIALHFVKYEVVWLELTDSCYLFHHTATQISVPSKHGNAALQMTKHHRCIYIALINMG